MSAAESRAGRIGILGLGAMGGGAAARLVETGFDVAGYDIRPDRNRVAEEAGVKIAGEPSDLARRCGIVICLVETGEQVIEVAEQVAAESGPGDLFLCMSTIDLPVIEQAAATISASGAEYVDAPVSGGGAAAASGSLIAMLGGTDAAVARCRPVVEALSSRHFHVGGVGQAFAAKMVNNLAFHTLSVAVIEAMALGTKAGLDPERMYRLLTQATGDSGALRMRVPRILSRDFEGVPLSVAFREFTMETGLAARHGVPVPLARVAEEVHRMGMARGLGPEDGAALVKVYEDWTGIRVEAKETP